MCVVIEGPQFSTRAESKLYQSWDADIIGMTTLPEAKLAREAEMCYATLACVTDYDTWHVSEEDVTVEVVIANLHRNVSLAQAVIRHRPGSGSGTALRLRLRPGERNRDRARPHT